MNLVLDDAEEVNVKKKMRKSLGGAIFTSSFLYSLFSLIFNIISLSISGRILLKGDNITLMMNT